MFGQLLTVKKSLPALTILVAKKAMRVVVIMTNIILKSRRENLDMMDFDLILKYSRMLKHKFCECRSFCGNSGYY